MAARERQEWFFEITGYKSRRVISIYGKESERNF
jgi:hypothetical protein